MDHFSFIRLAKAQPSITGIIQIEHDDIGGPAVEDLERIASVARGLGLVPIVGKNGAQQLTDVGIVIDDEDTSSCHS